MRTDLKILLVGIIVAFLFFLEAFKPLTPEDKAERQKQKNIALMAVFKDAVFLKHPITGECVEIFLKRDDGDSPTINRLITFRPCNCAKVPPEILITAENLKNP